MSEVIHLISDIQHQRYRSRSDKYALLDAALYRNEFNVILKVLIFCRNTLSRTNFYEMLTTRPEAIKFYTHFLLIVGDFGELIATLKALDMEDELFRTEFDRLTSRDESLSPFDQSNKIWGKELRPMDKLVFDNNNLFRVEQYTHKLQKLRSELTRNSADPTFTTITRTPNKNDMTSTPNKILNISAPNLTFLQEFLSFLQTLYTFYKLSSVSTSPPTKDAQNSSLQTLNTFYDLLIYSFTHYSHQNNKTTFHLNPQTLQNEFKVSPQLFASSLLYSLCRNSEWAQIEIQFLSNQNRFGGHFLSSKMILEFEFIAQVLVMFRAPKEVIMKFIYRIDDIDKKNTLMNILSS